MLDGAGQVRVTDFGLAGAIGSALGGGTPAYMAPELHHRQRPTVQSDLYALALVLYELFTGQKAFEARSLKEMARLHAEAEPPRPSTLVPDFEPELEALILRCLRKDPVRRLSSLQELDQALETLQRPSGLSSPKILPTTGDTYSATDSVWQAVTTRPRRLLGLTALFVIAILIWSRPWQKESNPAPTLEVSPVATAQTSEVRSGLAVLKIRNLTENPEVDWIGLAITEMLLSELSAGGRHRIVPAQEVHDALLDLDVEKEETLSGGELKRLHRRLQADQVITGSYGRLSGIEGVLRIDLRVLDTREGQVLAASGATGSEAQLFDLVFRIGEALRLELSNEGLSAEQSLAARMSLPQTPEAIRLYVEGTERLRSLDLAAARDLLERASELESEHPMPHAALAEVWWKLGYETRARQAAQEAAARAETLGTKARQEISARSAKLDHRLEEASAIYSDLLTQHPDRFDYRLSLVEVELELGNLEKANLLIDRARNLTSPLGDHPRLDYLQARIYGRQGLHQEQREAAQRAAERASSMGSRTLEAASLLREAVALQKLGNTEAEAIAVEQARSLYESLGNSAGLARCLQQMGNTLYRQGDLDGAERLLLRAQEIHERIGHRLNTGAVSLTLANIYRTRGQFEESRALLEEASSDFREVQNDAYLGRAQVNLGAVQLIRGDLAGAATHYRQALDLFSGLGSRFGTAVALNNLGEILTYSGDLADARRLFQDSQALARERGDQESLGYATFRLAEVYAAQGDLFVARAHYGQALDVLERSKSSLTAAEVRLGLARIALAEGGLDEAQTLSDQAEQVFRNADAQEMRARAQVLLGEILLRRLRVAEARKVVEEVRAQIVQGSDRLLDYDSRLLEGRLLGAEGETTAALALLDRLGSDATTAGYVGFELEAEVLAAEIADAGGEPSAGRRLDGLLARIEEHGYGALARRVRGLGETETKTR